MVGMHMVQGIKDHLIIPVKMTQDLEVFSSHHALLSVRRLNKTNIKS